MPPLHLRQEFPTLKAFKEALHAWAIEAHFEPRILKSDTGRVRVGCKRDPNCPFVIRCNWERKNGRAPLARVTVLRGTHTCLDGLGWRGVGAGGGGNGIQGGIGVGGLSGQQQQQQQGGVQLPLPQLEIRQDEEGNILGGARVLGPISPPHRNSNQGLDPGVAAVPVLPKVQRNSASRLPFLMEILPRLMNITKETTPVEIRECLLREYGAEVHLQQCRRAKTEILKKRAEGGEGSEMEGQNVTQGTSVGAGQAQGQGRSIDGMGSESAGDGNTHLYGSEMNGNGANGGEGPEHGFPLHTASGVVIPQAPLRREPALNAVAEAPVRCPYCINHRWMRSIKDAVEHMSMHVVV